MGVRNVQTREGYDYWDKICAIPRYGFIHSPDNSRVLKAEGIGNWIDMHAAQEVVDAAQDDINGLRAERDKLRAQLKELVNGMTRIMHATSLGDQAFSIACEVVGELDCIDAAKARGN